MKKILSLMILGILTLSLVGTVSAEEEINQDVPFSFISWFKHIFGIQEFSIVGDFRQCDRYPQKTFTYERGEPMSVYVDDYCSSGYGLINFYTGGWNPVSEMKDRFVNSGCNIPPCNIEVYCCPHEECSRDRDCEDWYGDGSECKSRLANDPNINYAYSTFSYCTEPSGIEVTCWYKSNEVCKSRRYIGDEYCPATYMTLKLYNSKSICESSISINGDDNGNGVCIPTSHDSKKCYNNDVYWYDSCGMREGKYKECGTVGCLNGICKTSDGNGIPTNGDGIPTNGNGEENGDVPSFSLNQTLFKVGDFNVTILTILLIIGGAFIVKIMFSKRK